ncbi:hypothetical protein M885DRAFT_617367, partial [Pelagophyceae sp. CCMP2097]
MSDPRRSPSDRAPSNKRPRAPDAPPAWPAPARPAAPPARTRPSDPPHSPPGASPAAATDDLRLFVRNLPYDTTEDDIRRAFDRVWRLEQVSLPRDSGTGRGRGFAYVTLAGNGTRASRADAERVCVAMQYVMMGHRPMRVEVATPRREPAGDGAPADPEPPRSGGRAMPDPAVHKPDFASTRDEAPWQQTQKKFAQAPRRAGNLAIALNKRLVACRAADDVLALFRDAGADFDPVNFATSLHRIGTLRGSFGASSLPLLHDLARCAASSIIKESTRWERWEPRELSNACWGVAKIGNVEPALFKAVAAVASQKIATFTAQALANTVWAYATAG